MLKSWQPTKAVPFNTTVKSTNKAGIFGRASNAINLCETCLMRFENLVFNAFRQKLGKKIEILRCDI